MPRNSVPAAAPGLPSATLTAARWGQLHDMLTLALDAAQALLLDAQGALSGGEA